MDYVVPFITGSIVGAIFAAVGAYVPAPPNIQGVLGVVGITIGYMVVIGLKR
ncbi:XapX, XapX domain [uncultured Caudovirales phage]|uniref:XapX, XapX domain n=1 Tax=uncultured Caudovirales phage TaxID=2100421 RepID=A0A6J5PTT5_9CAUD|nr:XapX, XapX domain [uncultured Caudovirales phage]CAB4184994.1 XapX, XapX domain [uncultured Caudovirales phage]CAB4192756.1 XapX, XapX domain [uncultured Caudovirales phage]CAB5231507.1 XapX, XapX domain [uncultured Caudovirales phage]